MSEKEKTENSGIYRKGLIGGKKMKDWWLDGIHSACVRFKKNPKKIAKGEKGKLNCKRVRRKAI